METLKDKLADPQVKEAMEKIRKLAPTIFKDWSEEKLAMFLVTMNDDSIRMLPDSERRQLARMLAKEKKEKGN